MPGTESPESWTKALLPRAPAVICAGFALWVVLAWASYDRKFAQAKQGWYPGGKYLVELTLTAQDRESPACAADAGLHNLRCDFGADRKRVDGVKGDFLRPYKPVNGSAFLAAGLWHSPSLAEPPRERFTVVCNFHFLGLVEPVAVRWKKKDKFENAKRALPAGMLQDCVIPP